MAKSKSSVDVDVNVKGKGTKKTTLEMKNLGKQTDKVSKSTAEANRNWKGASAQSSGASKNFSKMSQGMGGIVGAYATLAANIFAIGAAFRFLQSAGDLQKLKEGQVLYASATGVALRSLTTDIIAATDAQIKFTDASQAAAIGKAAGLTNDQLVKLGKGAKDVSIILGRDVTDSFNRLVRGVTKAEPELLDELGIILRLADASEKYGATIGKTANQLTQFEKSQAVTVEVLDQLESKYGRIMDIMEPEGNQFTKLGKAFDDIVNQIKELAAVVAGPIAEVLTRVPALAIGMMAVFANSLIKTGLSTWATNATLRAKNLSMGYIEAQARLEDLQRTQAKRVAGQKNIPAQTKRALQGQNPFKSTSGKTYKKIMKGETLSKRDQGYINRAVKANKLAGKKMSADWNIATKAMSKGTITATQQMLFAFKNLTGAIGIFGRRMLAGWSLIMKGMAAATAFAGKVMTAAMSFVSWISIIATVAMVIKQLFGAEEQADKTAETLNVAGEKVKALNEEFKKFNEIQKIVTEDGENMLKFFESLGNRISQLGTSMQNVLLDSAWEGFQNALDPTQIEQNLARIDVALQESTKSWRNLAGVADKWWTAYGGFGLWEGLFAADESEQFHSGVDELKGEIARLERIKTEIAGDIDKWDLGDNDFFNFLKRGFHDINETSMETIDHMSHFMNAFREGPELVARLENQIGLLKKQLGPANDALAGMGGNLIRYLKASGDVSQMELGKHYEGVIKSAEIIDSQFTDASNPVTDLLDYFADLENLEWSGGDILKEQLEEIKTTIASLTSRSNEWTAALKNANRMAVENAQEVDKVLLGVQSRSSAGRMEDTLKDEVLERLKSEGFNTEGLNRDQGTEYARMIQQTAAPSGLKGKGLEDWKERNQQLIRQIDLFDALDKRKDEATKRNLRQTLAEQQALLGTTKLVGARIKLEQTLVKNRNKAKDLADERFEIEQYILEVANDRGDLDYAGEEQQQRRLEQLDLELEILQAQNEQVERRLDLVKQLGDAAKQALESSMTKGIAAMLKGEEKSLKDTLAGMATAVLTSVVDTFAKQMSQNIMTSIFGEEKSEAQKNQEAIEAGGETVRASWEDLFNSFADQQAATASASAPSNFASDNLATGAQLYNNPARNRTASNFASDNLATGAQLYNNPARNRPAPAPKDEFLSWGRVFTALGARAKVEPTGASANDAVFTTDPALQAKLDNLLPNISGDDMQGGFEAEQNRSNAKVDAEFSAQAAETIKGMRHDSGVRAGRFVGPPERLKNEYSNAQKLGSAIGKDSATFAGEKKGGFMSKLTGFFSADSPWMTKLGDFFGGESSFLSGLSGIFGGLGDIFGQLMGGMGGAGGWLGIAMSIFGMANGGVIKGGFRKYANGGIANSPTLGMVGEGKYNEAIVPLPNGKAIPVDMRSSAQNNNVTVNVSSDGQTQTEGGDNEGLGRAIAHAVQEELQNQKRAGGILNRYGTA